MKHFIRASAGLLGYAVVRKSVAEGVDRDRRAQIEPSQVAAQTSIGSQRSLAAMERDLDGYRNALATVEQDLAGTRATLASAERDLDGYRNALATVEQDLAGTRAALRAAGCGPTAGLPTAVGVYGVSAHTLGVVELCRRNGVRVRFVVDDDPPAGAGWNPDDIRAGLRCRDITLVTRAEFPARLRAEPAGTPVFAACIGSELGQRPDEDPYLTATTAVRRACGVGVTLWHPASLAGAIPRPPSRGRVAIYGAPGSGNVLLQSLAGRLLAGPQQAGREEYEEHDWVGAFVEHLYLTTVNLVRGRVDERMPIGDVELMSMEFPTLLATLASRDGRHAVAKNIPTNRHHGIRFHWTHSSPSDESVAEFRRIGVPQVAVVRHPFETIVAWASKVTRPPGPVLDDPAWLAHNVGELAVWLRRLRGNRGGVAVVRYEDLTARDPAALLHLADVLGVPLAAGETGRCYDEVLFRDLLPDRAPGHFNRGGNEKWKKYLGRKHREVFARLGFADLFAAFGYDWEAAWQMPEPVPADGPAERFPPQQCGVVPIGVYSAAEWERLPGSIPYQVRSDCPALAAAVSDVLLSGEFRSLLEAGGVGTNPPPWVASFDWGVLATSA